MSFWGFNLVYHSLQAFTFSRIKLSLEILLHCQKFDPGKWPYNFLLPGDCRLLLEGIIGFHEQSKSIGGGLDKMKCRSQRTQCCQFRVDDTKKREIRESYNIMPNTCSDWKLKLGLETFHNQILFNISIPYTAYIIGWVQCGCMMSIKVLCTVKRINDSETKL